MTRPELPERPTPQQFQEWTDWHLDAARSKPNKPHRIFPGWYFYFAKDKRLTKMLEIRREYDEDTGTLIGWFINPFNGYCWGDPMPTKRAVMEYLNSDESLNL